MWCIIHTMNYCAAMKMSELLLCATQRNFNVRENNSDTAKESIDCIILFLCISQSGKTILWFS